MKKKRSAYSYKKRKAPASGRKGSSALTSSGKKKGKSSRPRGQIKRKRDGEILSSGRGGGKGASRHRRKERKKPGLYHRAEGEKSKDEHAYVDRRGKYPAYPLPGKMGKGEDESPQTQKRERSAPIVSGTEKGGADDPFLSQRKKKKKR